MNDLLTQNDAGLSQSLKISRLAICELLLTLRQTCRLIVMEITYDDPRKSVYSTRYGEDIDMMENLYYLIPGLIAAFCAYRAMISKHLLPSILYLACVSAMVSVILYLLKAYQVAVIELSVGAGLVTVLLVYALSVVGDDILDPTSIIPKPAAALLVVVLAILAGWMAFPAVSRQIAESEVLLADVLWVHRALDVWVQVALIFSGVIGVLGLLSEKAQKQGQQKAESWINEGTETGTVRVEEEVHV